MRGRPLEILMTSYPTLPATAHDEVVLVCVCYEDHAPKWGGVLERLGAGPEDATIPLDGGVTLRVAHDVAWDQVPGGALPALLPVGTTAAPVVAVADISAVYGDSGLLLVDARDMPGRGVRVADGRLASVLRQLVEGKLEFADLVRGMDRWGTYEGDGGDQATPTPTDVVRTGFPPLPAAEDLTLLVRTDFHDEEGWRAVLDSVAAYDDEGIDDEGDEEEDVIALRAVVVDDRAYEGLMPGQVPALVPAGPSTVMVALADAVTMSEPDRPLYAVDLHDTPGQAARVALDEAGSMAANLEIANMDFADFA
ncbi:DUF6924 domain-containing protein [Streptantibioticus parmotrematis]|nr:hypothetical protein [Streptantibioticus parmotrematis]